MAKAKERQLIDLVQEIREERLGHKENLEETKATIEDVVEGIERLLLDGWDVPLMKSGTFNIKERKARTAYNPSKLKELKEQGVSVEEAKRQSEVDVPASISVGFTPSKGLKAELNA